MSEDMPASNLRFENQVILTTTLTGFLGSIIIYFLHLPPIVVAIFLATGIAALVYRFLGGTKGTSMAMGTLKLSGSIAVLLGSAWFINGELKEQLNERGTGAIGHITFTPHRSNWLIIDKRTGLPLEVKVNETGELIPKSDQNTLRNNRLQLQCYTNKHFVSASEDSLFVLGSIEPENLENCSLFNKFQQTEDFVVTERLSPGGRDVLSPFPFEIRATVFANDYSHYILVDKLSKENIYEGRIYRRRFEIIELDNKKFFIAVVEVNHQPKSLLSKNPYAKFAIAEIQTTLR